MVARFTPLKPSSRSSSSGFSVFELIVATLMGTLILGFSLSLIVQQRRQFQVDQARGVLNRNLRGAMDFLTTDVRQGGEQLGLNRYVAGFALNGTGTSPNCTTTSFSLQRNLLSDVLVAGNTIAAGSSTATVVTDTGGGQDINVYNAWKNYRLAQSSSQTVAYILDTAATATTAAKAGEFFVYSGETSTFVAGAPYQLSRLGTWANSYNATTSFIYILEERQYSLVADASAPGTSILQMQINRGVSTANPSGGAAASPIANGLTNFQVFAQFPASVTPQARCSLNAAGFFNTADPDWRTLNYFSITLTSGQPNIWRTLTSAEKTRYFGNLQLSSQILPRNVISVQ
jgi:hypothetical protein